MTDSIIRELAELPLLEWAEFKNRWRALLGTEPPSGANRAYLERRLAWAMQNAHFGGPADTVRARLRGVLEAAGCNPLTGMPAQKADTTKRPRITQATIGTRWSRFWQGEWHEITFVEGGVSYRGGLFASPSAVATHVTGVHRSGPQWFTNKPASRKAHLTKGKQR